MCPELFEIGPVAIRSYGLMLAISFFIGVYYVIRISKKRNIDFNPLLTVAYILVFAGLIGARLSYVLFHLEEFSGNWSASFNPFHSGRFGIAGLNLYGGILLAIIITFIYLKAKKMSVLATFDIFAPTVGLGLFFTRIGCFLNGCCFGTPTDVPWGISFPEGSIPHHVFGSAHIHPAQIYSSLYGLALFIFLNWRLSNRRFVGQVIALLFMIEAVFRYAIEYVRYYEDEMHISFLGMNPTYNSLIAIALFLLGLVIYIYQYRKAGRAQPADTDEN
jgi:phosphatidylglycerol:prolipoprotein diacylglycerol transferase